jgi:hypothetical protein
VADSYLEYSAIMPIPADKIDRARTIAQRECAKFGEDGDCGGSCVEVDERGAWFHAQDYGNTDHVEAIAKALVEELEIDEPFVCSWAYTCSKPRIDEFGGGAMVVRRGRETAWIDALAHALDIAAGSNGKCIDAVGKEAA